MPTYTDLFPTSPPLPLPELSAAEVEQRTRPARTTVNGRDVPLGSDMRYVMHGLARGRDEYVAPMGIVKGYGR